MIKRNLITISIISIALSACGTGNSGNNTPQAPQAQPVSQYVTQLKQIDTNNSNDLTQAKSSLLAYYANAKIDQSISYRNTIVDCVPFLQQPALVNASAADQQHALEIFNQSTAVTNNICPSGDIALTRIPLRNFSNQNKDVFWKQALAADNNPESSASAPPSGYMYYQSESGTNVNFDTDGIFIAIDSGNEMANLDPTINVTDNQHYIQQEWLSSGKYPSLVTLETGIITSDYFIESSDGSYVQSEDNNARMSKSVFIFSTPNSYDSSTNRGNQVNMYNLQGGFIQLNNLVIFGAPLTNEKYNLSYVKKTDGYHLMVSVITLDNSGNYHVENPVDVGYWPNSHYSGFGSNFPDIPNFNSLSAGFEMETDPTMPNLSIKLTQSDGSLIGYGIADNNGNVESLNDISQTSFGPFLMTSGTRYQPTFLNTKLYTANNSVYDITLAQLEGDFLP